MFVQTVDTAFPAHALERDSLPRYSITANKNVLVFAEGTMGCGEYPTPE